MKSIITAVCVVLVIQTSESVNPMLGITRLKNEVNSASNDLTRYNSNFEYDLKRKLSNLKLNQMMNVNSAVNPAMDDVRNAIAKAKSEGRNADSCLEPARLQLRDASQTAFRELDNCEKNQLNTIKPVQQNIQAHLLNGKLLLSELDGIAISCASGTPMQVQICIAQKMPGASSSVQNFKSTADALKSTGNSISSSAEIGAIGCYQTQISKLHSDVSAARINANNCIKNAV